MGSHVSDETTEAQETWGNYFQGPKISSVEVKSELSLPDWDMLKLSTQLTGKPTASIFHPHPTNLGLTGPFHFWSKV